MLNNCREYYFSITFPYAQKKLPRKRFFYALTVVLPFNRKRCLFKEKLQNDFIQSILYRKRYLSSTFQEINEFLEGRNGVVLEQFIHWAIAWYLDKNLNALGALLKGPTVWTETIMRI